MGNLALAPRSRGSQVVFCRTNPVSRAAPRAVADNGRRRSAGGHRKTGSRRRHARAPRPGPASGSRRGRPSSGGWRSPGYRIAAGNVVGAWSDAVARARHESLEQPPRSPRLTRRREATRLRPRSEERAPTITAKRRRADHRDHAEGRRPPCPRGAGRHGRRDGAPRRCRARARSERTRLAAGRGIASQDALEFVRFLLF